MKKMKSLYIIEWNQNHRGTVTDMINEGCEWALTIGIPTQKFDGEACAVINGELYKRYDAKFDKKKKRWRKIPEGAIPCQPEADPISKHFPHWKKVNFDKPEDVSYKEAWKALTHPLEDGTYEMCGPKYHKNPENLETHQFIKHGSVILEVPDRSLEGLKNFLIDKDIEGIVFHHPCDDRMCKVKKRDFGMKREDIYDVLVNSDDKEINDEKMIK